MGLLNIDAYEGTAEILGETRHIRASSAEGLHIQGLSLADCNRIVGLLQTGRLEGINLGNETREAQSMIYDAVTEQEGASNGKKNGVSANPAPAKDPEPAEATPADAKETDEDKDDKPAKKASRKKAGRKPAAKKSTRKAKAAPPPPEEDEEDEDEDEEDEDEEDELAAQADDEDEEDENEDENEDEEDDEGIIEAAVEYAELIPKLQDFKRVRPVVGVIVNELEVEDLKTLTNICETIKDQVPALKSCGDIPKRVKLAAGTVGIHA